VGLAGCSVLPAAPYTQRRSWPILVPRPDPLPARQHGPVLLVRDVSAAPGLDRRGLQTMQPDGSLRVDFYEEWTVAPAEGVQAALQQWRAASGLYSAVVSPGSRLQADLALEGDLTRFWADIGNHQAEVALALVLLDLRRGGTRIRLQQTFAAEAPLGGPEAPAVAHAILAALAAAFTRATQALASV
jgi:cholesterol transport system auxiliary component